MLDVVKHFVSDLAQRQKLVWRRLRWGEKRASPNFSVESDGSAYNTLSSKAGGVAEDSKMGAQPRSVCVPVDTLDALIEKNTESDFIKIDVEGFEIEAF